jgi:hypothetical protein
MNGIGFVMHAPLYLKLQNYSPVINLAYSRTEIHSNCVQNPFCSSKLHIVQACIFRHFDKAEFF